MQCASAIMQKLYAHRRRQAIITLVFCIICLLASLSCVVIYVLLDPTDTEPEKGAEIFRYFTIQSNIIMAFACACALPFAVEGLRKDRVHLPTWCLRFVYLGTTSVALTLLFAVLLILPYMGFDLAFGGPRSFLHVVCPMLSILLFTALASDHRIKMKETLFSLSYFVIYAALYIANVIIFKSWRDIYRVTTTLPFAVSVIVICAMAFGVAYVLGVLHNRLCEKADDTAVEVIRKFVDIPAGYDITELIHEIARQTKSNPHIVAIPIDDLTAIAEIMQVNMTSEELCRIYLEGYYQPKK